MQRRTAALIALAVATAAAAAVAGENVSAHRHPNLAAAQRFVDDAVGKIDAAQHANEYDMAGHAAKAKELLEQARAELKLAAEAANKH